ncbi:hypothetical protein [Streptomyces sp. NPDC002676]
MGEGGIPPELAQHLMQAALEVEMDLHPAAEADLVGGRGSLDELPAGNVTVRTGRPHVQGMVLGVVQSVPGGSDRDDSVAQSRDGNQWGSRGVDAYADSRAVRSGMIASADSATAPPMTTTAGLSRMLRDAVTRAMDVAGRSRIFRAT